MHNRWARHHASSATRRTGVATLALLIAALPALITACGHTDHSAAPSNTTTSGASTPAEQEPPQPGRMFTATPNLIGAQPIPFTSWSKLAPDEIAVNFEIGSPECFGVDVTTTETDKTITIALRSGRLAEAAGRMCTMIEVFGTVDIHLKSPLGARKVLSTS